jgi:hypothetical protein
MTTWDLKSITEYEQRTNIISNWLDAHGFQPSYVRHRSPDKRGIAVRCVASLILSNINRYRETGYGDKPTDMHTIDYWLAHVDFDKMKELHGFSHVYKY